MGQIVSSTKWFILNFLFCPSCNSPLKPIGTEGQWNNIACTWCDFACRLVTAPNSPYDAVLAVRKAELENLLQLKKVLPPLMVHFKWESNGTTWERVVFWPFIAYRFLKEEHRAPIDLEPDHAPDVEIFSNMFTLPNTTLYESPSDEEIADAILKTWPQPIRASLIQEKYGMGYVRASRVRDLALDGLRKLGRLIDS